MSRIRLYLDEDTMQQGLLAALRSRRVDVVTALECGMVRHDDEEHLQYASGDGRALYSFNIGDYALIHRNWIVGGLTHHGIILAPQQSYSVGEQLRRLLQLLNRVSATEMKSRLEYLSGWGR